MVTTRTSRTSLSGSTYLFLDTCRIYTDIVDLQQQDSLSMSLLRAAHKFKLSGLMGKQQDSITVISTSLSFFRYRRSLWTSSRFIRECSLVRRVLLCRRRGRRRQPARILLVSYFHPLGWASTTRFYPHVGCTALQNAQGQNQESAALCCPSATRGCRISLSGWERRDGESDKIFDFLFFYFLTDKWL